MRHSTTRASKSVLVLMSVLIAHRIRLHFKFVVGVQVGVGRAIQFGDGHETRQMRVDKPDTHTILFARYAHSKVGMMSLHLCLVSVSVTIHVLVVCIRVVFSLSFLGSEYPT